MRLRSGGTFDVAARREEIERLSQKRLDPSFWDNPTEAQRVEKEIAAQKAWIDAWDSVKGRAEDIQTLIELSDEEEDAKA